MPVYEVTSPQGKTFEVTAPEGATQDQILAYAQQNFSQPQEESFLSKVGADLNARGDQLDTIINAYNSGEQGLARSALQAFGNVGLGGLSDIAGQAVSAVTPQSLKDAASSVLQYGLNSPLAEYGGNMIQPAYNQYQNYRQANPAVARDIDAAGNIVNALANFSPLAKGGQVAVDVAQAAPAAAMSLANTGRNAITNIASKASGALLPELDETSALLAKRAQELNIPLYLDQVAESPALNNIQKIGQELPFSGIEKRQSVQDAALNKAITQSFGQDSTTITPNLIKKSYRELGDQFDKTFEGRTVKVNDDVLGNFDEIALSAGQSVGENVQKIIRNNIDYIKSNVSGGEINGKKLNQVRSKLSENIRNAKGADGIAAQPFLGDLLDKVIDASFDGLDAGAKEAFADLRYKYKNLITVTPLAAKAKRGVINPQLLENRVSRVFGEKNYANGEAGVLGDIAKISKTFLPKSGGSDTVPKSIYAAGLLGVGATAAGGGIPAVAGLGLSIPANRIYQNFLANPSVVNSYVDNALARFNQLSDQSPLRIGAEQ